jgi:nucleotide-binding universal stress UspA family protein
MTVYVIGIDGSETAARAAARAGELAATTNARIHVVCAYTGGRAATTLKVGQDSFTFSVLSEAEQTAEQQAATYRAAGLKATSAVGEGKPGAVILEQADLVGADLIVIGNLRMQGPKRVLGAVANDILHHAPCDVLLVKTV